MQNQKSEGTLPKWDYNPRGNLIDETCRKLLSDALISEHIIGVLDVGDNSIFWPADIDLLIVNKHYKVNSVEVKGVGFGNMRHNTLNNLTVFLEYISNDKKYLESGGKKGVGCTRICKADFYLFYFVKLDAYLLTETKKLQEFLEKNLEKYPSKYSSTYGKDGQELYKTYGIIVPVTTLIQEVDGKYIKSNCSYAAYEQKVLNERNKKAS